MKPYNYRLVKKYRIYSIMELSKVLGVHPDTIRSWVKQGLKIVPETKSPILIKGLDTKNFLMHRSQKRKCKLKENEFFCLRCRKACKSTLENVRIEILESLLSVGNRKAVIYGKCDTCGLELRLFSSVRIVQKWLEQGWAFKENVAQRYSGVESPDNTCSQSVEISNFTGGNHD